ncbi:hypothetical protein M408DRAFT_121432 [Serendipita vermifera MAFF 305830]|uniref:Uncharacterized protein n=1 Tax=Serendipita vermifera MAFF 305830 TaxID=933852 RepID=A0A0C2XJM6_SERVB|nr:hypothetical protein M408DRAFT_121432 [Serendipita vermifera MAFF 305830]
MSSEQLTVTVDNTSPVIRYTPTQVTNDSNTGWTSYCIADNWRCDEHSAHATGLDGATFAFSFWGVGVNLYGNLTLGMNFTLAIDGSPRAINPGSGQDGQTLAEVQGLSAGQHTALITTIRGGSQSLLTFDKATITMGSATSVNKTYIGGGSSAVVYGPQPNPPWSSPQTYTGTVTPAGIDDTHYNASDKQGATFYHKFQGAAFFWYGPCYLETGSYTVTIDGNANSQPQQFNASLGYPNRVIESCLRYYAGGLSRGSGQQHEFLATNAENHWMTLQWLEVWDYELTSGGGSTVG